MYSLYAAGTDAWLKSNILPQVYFINCLVSSSFVAHSSYKQRMVEGRNNLFHIFVDCNRLLSTRYFRLSRIQEENLDARYSLQHQA
jgi:hypothetical protein